MVCFLVFLALLGFSSARVLEKPVDYSGHKVITVIPDNQEQLEFVRELGEKYKLDFWSEPRAFGVPIMVHLTPDVIDVVEKALKERKVSFVIAIFDLQSAIEVERKENEPLANISKRDLVHTFDKYHPLEMIHSILDTTITKYSPISSTLNLGQSYQGKPIRAIMICSDKTKPAILIESGIHAREWVSVASSLYIINELTSKYATDPKIKQLVDNYCWYILPSANPDGYTYTWKGDRMWRKTRSRSKYMSFAIPPWCLGADANRNFDIGFCELGASKDLCDEAYCGDAPFSESESRAIKGLIESLSGRLKAYFAVHSYSQLWMTPYGYKKEKPANYADLMRISKIGTDALTLLHGIKFRYGTIAETIYPASGSSIDWAYENGHVKVAFALELRDDGRYGFMLPKDQIIPTCEETWAGIQAAVLATV